MDMGSQSMKLTILYGITPFYSLHTIHLGSDNETRRGRTSSTSESLTSGRPDSLFVSVGSLASGVSVRPKAAPTGSNG